MSCTVNATQRGIIIPLERILLSVLWINECVGGTLIEGGSARALGPILIKNKTVLVLFWTAV